MTPEEVKQALKTKCGTCGALPGAECVSIISGKWLRDEPRGAVVHLYRRDVK